MSPGAATLKRWREGRGILAFVFELFGVTPDKWQEEALLAFASMLPEHQRISLQACAGPGKTAVLAWCGLWFLLCQGEPGEHPQGACVSISKDNLRDNLWKEYAKWINRSPILNSAFTWTSGRIFAKDHPETWFLSARAFSKSANSDQQGATLSGLHGKYVLCQCDESGDMPTTILRAGEQALSQADGGFAKVMQAGNPISLDGMLYAAANQLRSQWYVIRVTGDPDDPNAWVYSPRVGKKPLEQARLQIATYGRENPWVKAYILGQFPPASINALLGYEDVEAAMKRHYREDAYMWQQKRLGIDVARFGDDRSVIFPRQGIVAFNPVVMRIQNTIQIAARAARAIIKWGVEQTFVDDTGHWGHGVIDSLTTAGYNVMPVIYHGKAIDPRYKNARAENWMLMADWVKAGGALPHLEDMVAELTTPTYTFLAGQFVLEDKDQIKQRLGRSPDLADALANTFALPDMPAAMLQKLKGRNTTLHDGDPFEHLRDREDSGAGTITYDDLDDPLSRI